MIDKLLQIVAPHHCYSCAKLGQPLCQDCKYDIADEANDVCVVCATPSLDGICAGCTTTYDRAWYVGDRSGVLKDLIDGYKFERVKSTAYPLGDLLDMRLPVLPRNSIIVPVPTIAPHVRARGYDHALLIARRLGALRNLPVTSLLRRRDSFVQRGKSKRERFDQMRQTFECMKPLSADVVYIIVDDVVTTNATLRYCAHALREAGAAVVWAAVVARQPLDNKKDP